MTCNCLKNCSLEIVKKNQILEEIYNDASQPGSLSGLENFYRVLKNKKIKINRPELKNWLSTQNVYTRHKPIVKKFQRNQVIHVEQTIYGKLIQLIYKKFQNIMIIIAIQLRVSMFLVNLHGLYPLKIKNQIQFLKLLNL